MIQFLKILGIVLNVGGVWLTARRNMACWPVGIAGVTVYGWLFWRWKLYGDMSLQIFYFLAQIYGWWCWSRGSKGDESRPAHAGARALVTGVATAALAALGIVWFMTRFTDDVMPRIDGTLTAFSLLAEFWTARRYLESWMLWMLVDIGNISLFLYRGDPLTAALFAMFGTLAFYGLARWRAASAQESAA